MKEIDMDDLPDELHELLKKLPDMLKEVTRDVSMATDAHDLAHKAIDQFDSVTVDQWDGKSDASLEGVTKLINGDDDIVMYAKALTHVRYIIDKRLARARRQPSVVLQSLFSRKFRKNRDNVTDNMQVAITAVAMLRIKRELFEKYEVDDRPKARSPRNK